MSLLTAWTFLSPNLHKAVHHSDASPAGQESVQKKILKSSDNQTPELHKSCPSHVSSRNIETVPFAKVSLPRPNITVAQYHDDEEYLRSFDFRIFRARSPPVYS